jgi:D-alanyl-D-alanine carboxypeptidase
MVLVLGACAATPAIPGGSASPSPAAPVTSPLPSVPGSPVPSAAPGLDPAVIAKLQDVVDRSRARIPAPGLSVAVRLPDGTTHTFVAGDRQLSPPRPVEPDTVFAIASITKTFVTAVVLQLVDEGRVSLDDPLSRFLPRYPRARDITLRDLLGHTSGVHDYFSNPAYARRVFADRERRWTPREVLRFIQAPYCDPGDCFRYSNGNFILLGLVIEEVTGRPLSQVIRDRLLDPLGLSDTVFQPDDPTPRDAARGHLWGGGDLFYDQSGRSRVRPHLSASTVAWAAGAMASTASDLARWADALYGGEVVSAASLAEMLTFRPRDEYGLGTRTRDFLGHTAVGHLGGIRGYELAMWYFPEHDTSVVMLSNRGIYSTDRTMKLLVRALFEREGGSIPGPVASPGPSGTPTPSPSPSPVAPGG